MSKRDQVIERTTDRLRELTINELFEQNANASGQLAASIKYVPVSAESGNTAIAIEMEDYGFILDSGRGGAQRESGQSWQPKLVSWIKAKGIKPKPGVTVEQLSYAIYKSINRKGYKAKPFVEPALKTYTLQFADEYAEATADDIEVDLEKIK